MYYKCPINLIKEREFYYDLQAVVMKDITWESVFRLRVSKGFRIKQIYGNYSHKSNDLLNITCMDE
jgi:protein transport protein SEC24